jgi:hypothetical protein
VINEEVCARRCQPELKLTLGKKEAEEIDRRTAYLMTAGCAPIAALDDRRR